MRITHVETLVSKGAFAVSPEWAKIRAELHKAVENVDWPHGSGKFTIYPQSGKKTGEGNGVKPIKDTLMTQLKTTAWKLEESLKIIKGKQPGSLDAVFYDPAGPIAVEWETGNISSSHRALNKMALGMMRGLLVSATLLLPT